LSVDIDCDRDAIRFTVRQHGAGFCHLGTRSCWGEDHGIGRLSRRLAQIVDRPPPEGSNTARLLNDPDLLRAKLREEANELAQAESREDVTAEAADILYFTLVKAAASGVRVADIEDELDRRALRLKRRPMRERRENI
jgi:phosphoribosyl-ATP pyrophosphohydrolase